jgi:hypothetical protein
MGRASVLRAKTGGDAAQHRNAVAIRLPYVVNFDVAGRPLAIPHVTRDFARTLTRRTFASRDDIKRSSASQSPDGFKSRPRNQSKKTLRVPHDVERFCYFRACFFTTTG